jgi:hypothetical protein
MTGAEKIAGFETIEWDDVGDKVYMPLWEKHYGQFGTKLSGKTPSMLPEASADLPAFGRSLSPSRLGKDEAIDLAVLTVGCALALALRRLGWSLSAPPGAPVVFRKGEQAIEPFDVLKKLAAKELAPQAWQDASVAAGIAAIDLGAVGQKPEPPPDPDLELIERLKESGLSPQHPQPLAFLLCFSTEEAANNAAQQLRREGYVAFVQEKPVNGNERLCVATRTLVPDPATLGQIRGRMVDLADSLQGRYDGWSIAPAEPSEA